MLKITERFIMSFLNNEFFNETNILILKHLII